MCSMKVLRPKSGGLVALSGVLCRSFGWWTYRYLMKMYCKTLVSGRKAVRRAAANVGSVNNLQWQLVVA